MFVLQSDKVRFTRNGKRLIDLFSISFSGQREQPQPVREEGNWRSKMATSEELSKYELDFQANLNRKLQAGSKSSYFI